MSKALRLMRVCVCGHGRETHDNPNAVRIGGAPPSVSCRWVEWTNEEPHDATPKAICHCTWWRPLLIPRLRRVELERPMRLKRPSSRSPR